MPMFRTESLGRRIARLRGARGMTQQDVARRLAISRNAVSHLETGISQPSERTVVLLAGLFRVEPIDLVAGTDYPVAKADRLPLVAPRYTEVEMRLRVLEAELRWLSALDPIVAAGVAEDLVADLRATESVALDPSERARLRDAQREVRARLAEGNDATA